MSQKIRIEWERMGERGRTTKRDMNIKEGINSKFIEKAVKEENVFEFVMRFAVKSNRLFAYLQSLFIKKEIFSNSLSVF